MMDHDGVGWMVGGSLMMLLFWIVPIALIAWGVLSLRKGQGRSVHDETPLEILQRRYASGEISQDEFEQIRRALV